MHVLLFHCYCMHICICIHLCTPNYNQLSPYNATFINIFSVDHLTLDNQLVCPALKEEGFILAKFQWGQFIVTWPEHHGDRSMWWRRAICFLSTRKHSMRQEVTRNNTCSGKQIYSNLLSPLNPHLLKFAQLLNITPLSGDQASKHEPVWASYTN